MCCCCYRCRAQGELASELAWCLCVVGCGLWVKSTWHEGSKSTMKRGGGPARTLPQREHVTRCCRIRYSPASSFMWKAIRDPVQYRLPSERNAKIGPLATKATIRIPPMTNDPTVASRSYLHGRSQLSNDQIVTAELLLCRDRFGSKHTNALPPYPASPIGSPRPRVAPT
jgi:hypothetical protein